MLPAAFSYSLALMNMCGGKVLLIHAQKHRFEQRRAGAHATW
jgi:hypothetical protein